MNYYLCVHTGGNVLTPGWAVTGHYKQLHTAMIAAKRLKLKVSPTDKPLPKLRAAICITPYFLQLGDILFPDKFEVFELTIMFEGE